VSKKRQLGQIHSKDVELKKPLGGGGPTKSQGLLLPNPGEDEGTGWVTSRRPLQVKGGGKSIHPTPGE